MLEDVIATDEFTEMEVLLAEAQTKISDAFQYIRDARKVLRVSALGLTEKQRTDVVAEAQALTDVAVKAAASEIIKDEVLLK